MSYYPRYVYSCREDVTRANMREYDRKKKILEDKCLEIDPDYFHLNLRHRRKIWDQAEEALGIYL